MPIGRIDIEKELIMEQKRVLGEKWNLTNKTGLDIKIDWTDCYLVSHRQTILDKSGAIIQLCIPNDGITFFGLRSVFTSDGHTEIDNVKGINMLFAGNSLG